jgi:hypothetical protein
VIGHVEAAGGYELVKRALDGILQRKLS